MTWECVLALDGRPAVFSFSSLELRVPGVFG